MYVLPLDRRNLLRFLPKGGHVAEIGVQTGGFSDRILELNQPSRLHLIDPWEHQEDIAYKHDPANVSNDAHQSLFEKVQNRMARQIAAGQVTLWRDYSQNVAHKFEDGQFDWIFVDGLHTYEGVKSDLSLYHSKVKENGLLLGHDYANHVTARTMGFGVIEAVNEFVRDQGWVLLAMTNEIFPTYVLARSEQVPMAQHLIGGLLLHVPNIICIRDFPTARPMTQLDANINGQNRVVLSF